MTAVWHAVMADHDQKPKLHAERKDVKPKVTHGKVKYEKDVRPEKGEASRKLKVETDVKVKTEVGRKVKKEIVVETVKKEVLVKKERKTFELPGQKHEPPDERDPGRIFYETLYEQRPDSLMAQIWMMEHGLLPRDEAQRVLVKKGKVAISAPAKGGSASRRPAAAPVRSKPQAKPSEATKKASTPLKKASVTNGKASAARTVKKKEPAKYKEDDEDSDDEIIPLKKRR